MYDDDDAQVDGEQRVLSPYGGSMQAQPWLRGGLPPWHMWGTTERISLVVPVTGQAASVSQQLTRSNYKRPDTWHFVLYAQLIGADPLVAASLTSVSVAFNVTVGLGRSSITLPSFAVLGFTWDIPDPAPIGTSRWTTSVSAGPRFAGDSVPNIVEQIVGQDIQVEASVRLLTSTPQTVQVEVGSFWAPKTHVRPDWLRLDSPPESQFAGSEIEGR